MGKALKGQLKPRSVPNNLVNDQRKSLESGTRCGLFRNTVVETWMECDRRQHGGVLEKGFCRMFKENKKMGWEFHVQIKGIYANYRL